MSYEAVSWVLDNALVKGQAKVLLIAMADRCVGVGQSVCWPGLPDMMRRTGTRKSQCLELLKQLRLAGEIEVQETKHNGLTKYRLARYEDSLAPSLGPENPDLTTSGKPGPQPDTEVRKNGFQGPENPNLRSGKSDFQGPENQGAIITVQGTEGTGEQGAPPAASAKGFPVSEAEAIQWAMGAMGDEDVIQLWHRCEAVGGCVPWGNGQAIRNWRSFVAAEASRRRSEGVLTTDFKKNAPPANVMDMEDALADLTADSELSPVHLTMGLEELRQELLELNLKKPGAPLLADNLRRQIHRLERQERNVSYG